MRHSLEHDWLETKGGRIAIRHSPGDGPGVLFLGGFYSDMSGSKAGFLEERCRAAGRAFTRFDYRGHGNSDGDFAQLCLSDWLADTLAVLDMATQGPQILVGSSMGGWLMLLAAHRRKERVAGLVGIAAAPDFTEDLMWARLSPDLQQKMQRDGMIIEPSNYQSDPVPMTWKLIDDGRRHLLLRAPIDVRCPVHLLQGMADPDVPWERAPLLAEKLISAEVTVTLLKGGDHRLSKPEELAILANVLGI